MHDLTPADLARELNVSPRRIRAVLRAEFGALTSAEGRWRIDNAQAAIVRSRLTVPNIAMLAVPSEPTRTLAKELSEAVPGGSSLSGSSVPDLLEMYASILTELKVRNVIRTSNAPLGDYAEYLAQKVYGGLLAPNSSKGFDITAADGRLVQIKARTVGEGTSKSAVFSVFRSFDFDVATLLAFDATTYDLLWARELAPSDVEASSRWSSHVNGRLLRISLAASLGRDVTGRFMDLLTRLEEDSHELADGSPLRL